jgi:hypothetical protein
MPRMWNSREWHPSKRHVCSVQCKIGASIDSQEAGCSENKQRNRVEARENVPANAPANAAAHDPVLRNASTGRSATGCGFLSRLRILCSLRISPTRMEYVRCAQSCVVVGSRGNRRRSPNMQERPRRRRGCRAGRDRVDRSGSRSQSAPLSDVVLGHAPESRASTDKSEAVVTAADSSATGGGVEELAARLNDLPLAWRSPLSGPSVFPNRPLHSPSRKTQDTGVPGLLADAQLEMHQLAAFNAHLLQQIAQSADLILRLSRQNAALAAQLHTSILAPIPSS